MSTNCESSGVSLSEDQANSQHELSDCESIASSISTEEFYDAISGEDKPTVSKCEPEVSRLTVSVQNPMADSGIYSMHSSHVEPQMTSDNLATKLDELVQKTFRSEILQSGENPTHTELETVGSNEPLMIPRPPPRTRKRKILGKQDANDLSQSVDNTGNNSSSADSHSISNSIESSTPSFGQNIIINQNLTSILDDIVSIKGDLSITEVDDKRSIYFDEHVMNRTPILKSSTAKQELKELTKSLNADENAVKKSDPLGMPSGVLNQVMVMNIDTGEKVPLEQAENILPKCLNPLSLHLMKLTNDYENSELKNSSLEKETSSSSLADSTFKSVSSLISTLSDKKDKSLDKKMKKKLIKESKANEEDENLNDYDDDDDDDDDKISVDYKDGKIKSKIRDLKKLGTGLIRGVKGVKSSSAKERSTFHVDLKSYSTDPEPPPPPPRYKIKVNHKRGGADFDGLRLIQETNDCKGAIWCMKFSNCSQLLAAAGQDHLLRVYCAQKSWKYFTQLRNKASGQHISPSSTKERGDSMNRLTQKSYSRSGSLNTCDSHNNSSSSSSSSAFAKELYREEDNTLSEEGPLLLFTVYRGHTADVLDLAWSKNHFLLSSSMDKTVRLWHITRIECLCTFRHIDFVTTIQFHPRDDRYFLSGSLDGKLRLWNIPDKRVTLWNEVPSLSNATGNGNSNKNSNDSDMSPSHGLITASSFVQNGKFAVIGTYDGRIIFYTTDQLKYFTQIHVSGKNLHSSSTQGSSGRRFRTNKVTGIESIDDNNKILVTTNDSRLRLYDLRDLSLTCKYKGCINQSSQIKAATSHDHKYIICGSENNSFYIWRVQDNSTIGQRRDRNKQYECIRLLNLPVSAPTTAPLFEPQGTSSGGPSNSTTNSVASSNKVLSQELSGSSEPSRSVAFGSMPPDKMTQSGVAPSNQPPPAATYSSAATKIVTSAIFAPVPGQIDEKARYVIATADFNGYIRIFSK